MFRTRRASTPARRRRLLLLFGGLGIAGLASKSIAAAKAGFRQLQRPVSVPLQKLAAAWQTQSFDAYCCGPGAEARILLRGIALRLPDMNGQKRFKAFSRFCPHEMCYVDFTADPHRIPADTVRLSSDPVFVCPCHLSVFGAGGARLAGPAARGLFQFRISIGADQLMINEVEEEVLWW